MKMFIIKGGGELHMALCEKVIAKQLFHFF